MSALNLILGDECAHVLTDGAIYDRSTGLLTGIRSKAAFPYGLAAVLAWRGAAAPQAIIMTVMRLVLTRFDTLAEAFQGTLDHCRQNHEEFSAHDKSRDSFEVMLVGHSEAEDAIVARGTGGTEASAATFGAEPWALQHIEGSVINPCPSDEYLARHGRCLPGWLECFAAADVDGQLLLAMQRAQLYPVDPADKASRLISCVGGFGECTGVTKLGVERRVIMKWPDRVGELIGASG